MDTATLRSHLVAILVKGTARGSGITYTPAEAEAALDSMVASDDAPEWDAIREGREHMALLVSHLR